LKFVLLTFQLQKKSKEDRAGRNLAIGLNERYLLEVLAQCFGKDEQIFYDCAADSADNINTLSSLFERDGSLMILIQVQMDNSPPMGKWKSMSF
jgi:hypothetical protein